MTRGPFHRSPARLAALAAAALLALPLAACSSDGGSDAASSTTAKATTTTAAGSSTTTGDETTTTAGGSSTTTTGGGGASSTTLPTTGPSGETTPGLGSLPEGNHYGYFTGVSDGMVEGQPVQVVAFDKVEFLTGQAAIDAAIAHGDAEPGATSVDNDYYIVNDNTSLRLLPVIPDGVVSVIRDGSTEPQPGSIDEAVNLPTLYKVEIVVVRGISLITATEGVYLP